MDWYAENDGRLCGCIEPTPPVPLFCRRFSGCGILDVSPSHPQAYFRIAPSVRYDGSSFTFANMDAYMEVRYKGREELIATYPAWRIDANGYVGFYFDDTLWQNKPGFYVGDIFLNCAYCLSVQLRLPRCEAVVTDCYAQPVLETCGDVCCGIIDMAGDGMAGGGTCGVPTSPPFYDLTNPGPMVPSDCIEVCYPPGPSCVSAGSNTAG